MNKDIDRLKRLGLEHLQECPDELEQALLAILTKAAAQDKTKDKKK